MSRFLFLWKGHVMKTSTVVATLSLFCAAPAWAAAGKVSFLEGKATRQAGGAGAKVALAIGAEIEEKDLIATEAKSRLELTLADQSILRVGPTSQALIDAAQFQGDERRFSAKLVLGNVWAKVTSALGSDQKFEVTTDRAVAGVRGTTFRVDSRKDKAVVVKVFAGAVAVAGASIPRPEAATNSGGKKARTPVAGPHQVTKQEWEKLVGAQMKITVAADGTPGEPEKFAQADECKDGWTRWNRERDGEPCP
jgi:hypothetical protein